MAWYSAVISNDLKDLWISSGFILVTLVCSELLRLIIKFLYKGKEGFSKRVICELIASAELCSSGYELCIIADNYGIWTYAWYLFLLCIWWSFRWGDATACPYTLIEDMLQGQARFKHVIVLILIQLLAGCSVYPLYVKKFWLYKFESRHAQRLLANVCAADLTLPAYQGAFVEGLATCMCQLTGRVMSQVNPKVGNIVNAFIGTALVVAAFDMSGGYFNPVLATSLQYKCGSVSKMDHFTVYWAGAISGSVLSVLIWNSSAISRKLLPASDNAKLE